MVVAFPLTILGRGTHEHGRLTNDRHREQIGSLMAALWERTLLLRGRSS
jgi:hypothetical protein